MHVDLQRTEPALVCHLVGNLEQHTAPDFREAIASMPAVPHLVFDLCAVPFIDSSGLGALIGAVRRIRELGTDVVICSPRPSIKRVLEMVELDRVVPVLPALEDAARYFSHAGVA
ncbi:MAG: anti-sigma factor antagonist [Acidimicrobiales bacterium]